MLDKNSKISVLRTMIGLGEEIEPHFIVPQNSISNFRQKLGLSEHATPTTIPTLIPLENSIRTAASAGKCPHCENMAKNFLYLESLIRSNYNAKSQCGLCYSSLKYLQYVNKNIMQVFGNFDSIVQAAKVFTSSQRRTSLNEDAATRPIGSAHKIRHTHSTVSSVLKGKAPSKAVSKHRLTKTRSKASKLRVSAKRSKYSTTQKSISNLRLPGGNAENKSLKKTRSRHNAKKSKKSKLHTVLEDKPKPKHIKALRKKVNVIIRTLKQKNIKSKRNKVAMAHLAK